MKKITITTAVELTAAHKKKIEAKLSKKIGAKSTFSYRVNSSLIGGITVAIDSIAYDGSVRTKLDTIQQALYQNL